MVKVNIKYANQSIKSVSVYGHAKYADYGKDIVCASASSIVITSVNGILSIYDDVISYEENNDYIKIEVLKNNEISNKLLNNMVSLLKELSNDYPKNIKIKED